MRILALDIGGTYIKAALFEGGKIVEIRQVPSVTKQERRIEKNAIALARTYSKIDAVGAAFTGQIDQESQCLIFEYGVKTTAEGIGHPVGKILSEGIGSQVFLLNDSNAAAMGEALYGAGRTYPQMILLTYGTGVGSGIIINGKIFGGTRGIAGEVGHMVIRGNGKNICRCGNRGCYEAYASTTALVGFAKNVDPSITNGRQFFEKLPENPRLKPVLLRWIRNIVDGLCTLTYIFNPPCIVLGGGVMERQDVLTLIRRCFFQRVIPTFSQVDLLKAQLGNQAGLYGAYAYTCERLNISREA